MFKDEWTEMYVFIVPASRLKQKSHLFNVHGASQKWLCDVQLQNKTQPHWIVLFIAMN